MNEIIYNVYDIDRGWFLCIMHHGLIVIFFFILFVYLLPLQFQDKYMYIFQFLRHIHPSIAASASALANVGALLDALALSSACIHALDASTFLVKALWQRRSLVL